MIDYMQTMEYLQATGGECLLKPEITHHQRFFDFSDESSYTPPAISGNHAVAFAIGSHL